MATHDEILTMIETHNASMYNSYEFEVFTEKVFKLRFGETGEPE